ncbi:radical SAM protein [Candidatus Pelagibacter sp.]|nr:radical SAM protein [Candidatus Pelagibacter sp.]
MNPKKIIPINKGNYSMETKERDDEYEKKLSSGWEEGYKDYRKKWVDYAKNQIVSDYPLLVDIELSSICNLKCPMCYTITDKFGQMVNTKRMDMELFKKIIDEIAYKVPAIRLSLRGESTLHKNFAECVEYAKNNGIKEISTLTHGFKLTLSFFEKIAKAGIDWITISIDGTDKMYESIRKPLKFNDLLQKIKDIKKYKDKNNLKKPVIKIQGIWPAVKENIDKYYDTFAPIVDKVAFNPLIDYLWNDDEIEYLEDFSCPQQYQRLVIGADGLVMKCSNDEENVEIVGDATKQSVHEIWHGDKMTKVREMHKEERGFLKSEICRKCYLPRKTSEEIVKVKNRELIVRNYTKRSQIVGT